MPTHFLESQPKKILWREAVRIEFHLFDCARSFLDSHLMKSLLAMFPTTLCCEFLIQHGSTECGNFNVRPFLCVFPGIALLKMV